MNEKSNYFPERRSNQPSLTTVWATIIVLAALVIVVICVQSNRWSDQQTQIHRVEAKLQAGAGDNELLVVSDIEFGRFMTLFNEAVAGGDDTLAPFVFRWESKVLETQVTWDGNIIWKDSDNGVSISYPIGTSEDDADDVEVYARFADDGGYDSSRSIDDTVMIKDIIHIFGNNILLLKCRLIDAKD